MLSLFGEGTFDAATVYVNAAKVRITIRYRYCLSVSRLLICFVVLTSDSLFFLQASLETVKTKKGDFQLLNCDDHRRLVTKKSGKDPKDLRPDIVHQVGILNPLAAKLEACASAVASVGVTIFFTIS